MTERFFDRVEFSGTPEQLVSQICEDYRIGKLEDFSVPAMGYEDLNIALTTDQGQYFAKVFASNRPTSDARRLAKTIEAAMRIGVRHPTLIPDQRGNNFYQFPGNNGPINMVLMDYIDCGTILGSDELLTQTEAQEVIRQAALINNISFNPRHIYDSWSIYHFLDEFDKKKKALNLSELAVVSRIATRFDHVPFRELPHSFVHADIRSSNVLRHSDGNLYIVDFGVSNYQPRIIELAVMLSEIFFVPGQERTQLEWAVREYQKYTKLTAHEVVFLPLFVEVGHAANLMGAEYEGMVNKNRLEENDRWLAISRLGLGIDS